MALGTAGELFLLGHYEGGWQLVPILIIGMSLFCMIIMLVRPLRLINRVFLILMLISCLSGLVGIWFHLKANYEFESELYASKSFSENMWASFSGALPALAPGSMIVFGLIGIVFSQLFKNKLLVK